MPTEQKDKKMEKKIIQACISKCDKKPFTVKVGNRTHTFCCEKGFNKTMDDFAKYINDNT